MSRRRETPSKPELDAAFREARAQLDGIGQQLAAKAATHPRRLATAEELAPRLHKDPRYLKRNWKKLPFARQLPYSREILFDEDAFEEYLANLPGPTR